MLLTHTSRRDLLVQLVQGPGLPFYFFSRYTELEERRVLFAGEDVSLVSLDCSVSSHWWRYNRVWFPCLEGPFLLRPWLDSDQSSLTLVERHSFERNWKPKDHKIDRESRRSVGQLVGDVTMFGLTTDRPASVFFFSLSLITHYVVGLLDWADYFGVKFWKTSQ